VGHSFRGPGFGTVSVHAGVTAITELAVKSGLRNRFPPNNPKQSILALSRFPNADGASEFGYLANAQVHAQVVLLFSVSIRTLRSDLWSIRGTIHLENDDSRDDPRPKMLAGRTRAKTVFGRANKIKSLGMKSHRSLDLHDARRLPGAFAGREDGRRFGLRSFHWKALANAPDAKAQSLDRQKLCEEKQP
jgi:hypothetical protein